MQNFYAEIWVGDVHSNFNQIEINELDNTYKRESKCIDLIAVSYKLLNYIEESRLFDIDEITLMDHWVYVIVLTSSNTSQNNFVHGITSIGVF